MDRLESLLALLALDRLPRTGWVQRGVAAPESVAGHALGVAHLVLALGPEVRPALDLGRALAIALVHDAPEALTGDLPRTGARHLPEGAKAALEEGAAAELLAPLSDHALACFRDYAARESREARFVHVCDRLQLGLRLFGYLRAGARGLDDFLPGLRALDASEFEPARRLRDELLAAIEP